MLEQSPSPGKTLALVVDDEPFVRMNAVDVVEEAGFAVLEASNADEAMHVLESHADVGILVTDIDMPAGSMDGLGLAASVHDRWPSIKIIIVSGRYQATLAEIPDGSVFLSKPYRPDVLVTQLIRFSA
jgi:CheY-like chemotaxis protein